MSRRSYHRRKQTKTDFPVLSSSLVAHFGERFWVQYSSFSEAMNAAVEEIDHRERKQALREWWDWNSSVGAVNDPRTEIAFLGVEPPFATETEARQFMNSYYDSMHFKVREKEPGWKP